MTGFVNRAADAIHLDFSRTINKVSHDVLIAELEILGKWTIRWVEHLSIRFRG